VVCLYPSRSWYSIKRPEGMQGWVDHRWTRSVINWTVFRWTKLTILATVDGQFITLSVYLCVQHGAHEAARRAGSSATSDTCYTLRLRYIKYRMHFFGKNWTSVIAVVFLWFFDTYTFIVPNVFTYLLTNLTERGKAVRQSLTVGIV